jgi:hypothetical protein
MKRVVVQVAAAFAVLAATREARAIELGTRATEHPHRTAQNFALELRFSPYTPQIDEEPGLVGTPFADTFGDKPRLYFGLELDWQTLRIPHLGTIGPGLSAGMVSMSRNVRTASGRESGDETSLDIYPFYGVAVLRADVLWRDLGFPLVPYAKAGVGLALWRASNTGGTADVNGIKGKGESWGTNVALGVAFALDAIDPGASRNMDNATGINNTYVYFEQYWLSLNGFGGGNTLRVGTATWAMGLAFEF